MPSSTTSGSSNLYVPGSSGSSAAGAVSGPEVPAFLERAMASMEDYARAEPWAFAGWAFGIGFILGWKLKPW